MNHDYRKGYTVTDRRRQPVDVEATFIEIVGRLSADRAFLTWATYASAALASNDGEA